MKINVKRCVDTCEKKKRSAMSGTLCLTSRTTTTDQSHEEEEDSDVFALRDTYTKRLLLLTMMTEQQTCMDAIVDQNFSECLDPSSSSPPGSSEMMMMPAAMGGGIETASAESSCTSSTPFEEWVRTVGFFPLLLLSSSSFFFFLVSCMYSMSHQQQTLYCFFAEFVCKESRACACLERLLQPKNKEL